MDQVRYPFGAATVEALNGALASNAVEVSNDLTILSIAPGIDTTIALTASDELAVGSTVVVLASVGATAYDIAFTGANAATLTAEAQTANGHSAITLVFDGAAFWQTAVSVYA